MDATQFAHGDVVEQQQTLSATEDLHESLLAFWKPTWGTLETVDADTWQRVISFFQAYVPRFKFELETISLWQWKRALRRYKKTAARGVDGISHVDLQALPDVWTQRLLDLLHDIEQGNSAWPTALLFGVVSVIAKDVAASTVDRFRPIVIFSVICRTWASLRSQQPLRALAPRMDVEAYGFLPGCEPSQLWSLLQAEIDTPLNATLNCVDSALICRGPSTSYRASTLWL